MTFSAVLLAGGESCRMGRDKAILVYEGEPLWRRQLSLLRQLGPETIFVSARTEPAWRPSDTILALDEPRSHGPMSGIAAAFACCPTHHLVALAIDMPGMTAAHLAALLAIATPGSGVLPMRNGRAEPLAAVYPREASEEITAALTRGEFSLQRCTRALVDAGKLQVYQIPRSEEPLYANWNTPSESEFRVGCVSEV